jgi:FolB domain-containing protein
VDKITLCDLEVSCRVGVPEDERARPQRLLLTVEMECDSRAAAATDDISRTVDYYRVSRRLISMTSEGSWKLIETLAGDVARLVLAEFAVDAVSVEVKKFILPETRHVSVKIRRERMLA